jgi:hypothetical protein
MADAFIVRFERHLVFYVNITALAYISSFFLAFLAPLTALGSPLGGVPLVWVKPLGYGILLLPFVLSLLVSLREEDIVDD